MKILFIIFACLPLTSIAQNIGVGDPVPNTKLSVQGSETSLNGLNAGIKLRNTASTNAWYIRAGATGTATVANGLSIGDNTTYHVQLTNTGFLGLGIVPTATLHVNGGFKIESTNVLEFGAGIANKEVNAGKIMYNGFGTNTLAIVGAGNTVGTRRITLFAEGGTFLKGSLFAEGISFLDGGFIASGLAATNGLLQVNGELNTAGTNSVHMLPICMGVVGQFGEVVGGTGNFTVSYNPTTYDKDITITGETYTNQGYITIITNIREYAGIHFAMTNAVDGKLRVSQATTGFGGNTPTNAAFHFVVYKL